MGFKSNLKSTEVKSVLILFLYAYMTVLGQFLSTARYCAGLILRCSIFIYHSQLQKLEKLVFSPSHSDRNTNLKVFFFFFLFVDVQCDFTTDSRHSSISYLYSLMQTQKAFDVCEENKFWALLVLIVRLSHLNFFHL